MAKESENNGQGELEREIEDFLEGLPPVGETPEDPPEPTGAEGDEVTDPPPDPELPTGDDPPQPSDPPAAQPPADPPAADPEPPPAGDVETLKAQVQSLQQLVNQLAGPKAEPPKAEAPALDLGLNELIEQTDFDEIMEDKTKFMGFLVSAMQKASLATAQHLMGGLPEVVNQHVNFQEVRKNFYETYPQLSNVKDYVSTVASAVANEPESAGWTMAQVLQEAAVRSCKALNLPLPEDTPGSSPSTPPAPQPKQKPTLPGGTNSPRKPAPKKGELQSEIDELNDDLY